MVLEGPSLDSEDFLPLYIVSVKYRYKTSKAQTPLFVAKDHHVFYHLSVVSLVHLRNHIKILFFDEL